MSVDDLIDDASYVEFVAVDRFFAFFVQLGQLLPQDVLLMLLNKCVSL